MLEQFSLLLWAEHWRKIRQCPRSMNIKHLLGSAVFLSLLINNAFGADRDFYVASSGTNSIKRYDGVTGAYIGDFVAPNSGGLSNPQGCMFGPDGNLYVTGANNTAVLRYDGKTGAFMGAFTSGASLHFGADMSFHNGCLYVSDFYKQGSVYRFDQNTGQLVGSFLNDSPPGCDGQSWDADGNLLVSSFGSGTVRKYSANGTYLGDFATLPTGGKPLANHLGSDGFFYVCDFTHGSVAKFNGTSGAYIGTFVSNLGQCQGQAIGPDGGFYAGSYDQSFINEYDSKTGALMRTFIPAKSGGLLQPNDFTFGPPLTVLGNISPASATVVGGQSLGIKVNFSKAPGQNGITFHLDNSNPSVATSPKAGDYLLGSASASYALSLVTTAQTTSQPVMLTASYDGVSTTATFNVVPRSATVMDASYQTLRGRLTVTAPGVLKGASGATGFQAVLVSFPKKARQFRLYSDGSFYYTPFPSNNTYTDSFMFKAIGPNNEMSNTATVTITVGP